MKGPLPLGAALSVDLNYAYKNKHQSGKISIDDTINNKSESYDLTKLNPSAFEHLVNALALRVLGWGHTGFGPGSDGGRDGYFEGEAPYPSDSERWSGRWYIQSKFHAPHLSRDPQKWLLEQINSELTEFTKPDTKREWPDNWIIVTNIEPSGVPETGAFDQARALVEAVNPALKERFHIWGGQKIIDLLTHQPEVARRYSQFLTPGHVISALYDQLNDAQASIEAIIQFLIVRQFDEQQHTKLEQAGYTSDARPGIHQLFIDLPFRVMMPFGSESSESGRGRRAVQLPIRQGMVTSYLMRAAAENHQINSDSPDTPEWQRWRKNPSRARVWFIKGGPGQGKSTIGQFFCQIQRACLILENDIQVTPAVKALAWQVKRSVQAGETNFWPSVPRIPIAVELREYAHWLSNRSTGAVGILTYLAEVISNGVEERVEVGTLKRALGTRSWFVAFDGLDEVPHDTKDTVAKEVLRFINEVATESKADLLSVCTSRPQGYSGQFSDIDGPVVELVPLSPQQALLCAKPVIELSRPGPDAEEAFKTLESAIQSSSVAELMTTPLQSHIMAVVVRDGGRPPERRWQLFTNFYNVIRKREANRNLPDPLLAKLLREDEQLLKTVHDRLGFLLHARAETSKGAQTNLSRDEFKILVEQAASQLLEGDTTEMVNVLMRATTERLVLVSTPVDSNHVQFHIRPLQEFFAAEFLYGSVGADELRTRLEVIAGDAHWREVVHFLLSALVENGRQTELSVAVAVLNQLDQGDNEDGADESSEQRTLQVLRSRLGRGAILSARLLQEGVLEQDRRVRQQFRNVLKPLNAIGDIRVLMPILHTIQPQSRRWLLNFLVDSMKQATPNEVIGAGIVLARILEDEDELKNEAQSLFLSMPVDYISFIASLIEPLFVEDIEDSVFIHCDQDWLIEVLLHVLVEPTWMNLKASAFVSILNAISSRIEQTCRIARDNGWSEDEVRLLRTLAEADGRRGGFHQSRSTEIVEDWGYLTATCFEHDWTTGNFNVEGWTEESIQVVTTARGALHFTHKILLFGATQQLSQLHEIVDMVKDENGLKLLDVFPRQLTAYLPLNTRIFETESDTLTLLKSLDEQELETLLREGQIRGRRFFRSYSSIARPGDECTIEQWDNLVRALPQFALDAWIYPNLSDGSKSEFLEDVAVFDTILDELERRPALLLNMPYAWNKIFEATNPRCSSLREKMVAVAPNAPIGNDVWWGHRVNKHFVVSLPDEACLIPHLTSFMLPSYASNAHILLEQNGKDWGLEEQVGSYFPDINLLRVVADDDEQSVAVRASAALMFVLHPSGNKDISPWHGVLAKAVSENIGEWYVRVLTTCLYLVASEENFTARLIVGGILERSSNNYNDLEFVNWLLNSWRESSIAPVSKSNLQDAWLEGNH